MFNTVLGALLPIVITLLLGMVAGWHKDFDTRQAGILNRMVMLYALPLTLFASMVQISRGELLSNGKLFLLILIAMGGGLVLVYLISRYVFKREMGTAILQALAISGPAVPFVGVPVLGYLFGIDSAMPIAISAIVMNLIQVPICLVFLSMAKAGNMPGTKNMGLVSHMLDAVKEPVVWAPVCALILILFEIKLPVTLNNSLTLLGKSTGGVALFASGIVLFAQRVRLNMSVLISVISKNIILPLIVYALARLIHVPHAQMFEAVMAMAIPTASITVILAVQYETAESEMASTLFISTLASILTMAGFIWLIN